MGDREEYYNDDSWWEEPTYCPYTGREYWYCGKCGKRRVVEPCVKCGKEVKKKKIKEYVDNRRVNLILASEIYDIIKKEYPDQKSYQEFVINLLNYWKDSEIEDKFYNENCWRQRLAIVPEEIGRVFRTIPSSDQNKSRKINYIIWRYLKEKGFLKNELDDKISEFDK